MKGLEMVGFYINANDKSLMYKNFDEGDAFYVWYLEEKKIIYIIYKHTIYIKLLVT